MFIMGPKGYNHAAAAAGAGSAPVAALEAPGTGVGGKNMGRYVYA